jgi:enterochelin esterase-like enzyme
MTFPSHHPRPSGRRGAPRRTTALLLTAALGVTLSPSWAPSPATAAQTTAQTTAVQAAAQATPRTTGQESFTQAPGVSVSEGIVTIKIPASTLADSLGTFTSAVLEGDLAPSANVAELGLGRNGDDWVSTIGPLPPGLYRYRVRADDLRIAADTTNPNVVTSDPTWRTFLVPGKGAELLTDAPAGTRGELNHLSYRGGKAHVWTPAGYDAQRRKPYPVLFLNSGKDADGHDWLDLGRAGQIIDHLTLQRRAEPMVVVIADDSQRGLKDLGREVERRFNVARDVEHRAIAGVSTGADEALRTALTGHSKFAYVGAFSTTSGAGTLLLRQRQHPGTTHDRTKLLRLYTGNVTDPAYNTTYRLIRDLDRAHVRYEFDGVNPDAGHNWTAWQENLEDFAQRLFRPVAQHGRSAGHLPLTQEFTTPPSGTPTPWLTKDANGDGFVTVETGTDFADAKHVTLWGNWAPGGSWVNVQTTKVGNRWRATVGPLKPWFYYYKFLVDLKSEKDTANPTKITTEPTWSTVLVPGERSRLLADVPPGKGGKVETLTYHSAVAAETRSAYVWTPPGYDPDRAQPYPVLYLQHGGGQHYTDWVEMGRARQILDNLSLDKKLVPMVVVMGEGNVSDFTPELRENLAPAARAKFNIASDPAHQALSGLSMGGFQTYWLLRDHPGEFAWIGTFSSAIGFPGQPIDGAGYDAEAINAGTKLLQVYVGNVTDFVHPFAIQTMQAFDKIGVRYQFDGETPGPHGWDAWQKNLIDFAPRLFRSDAG